MTRQFRTVLTVSIAAGVAFAASGCGGSTSSTPLPVSVTTPTPTTYSFAGVVAGIPSPVPAGSFFDISFVDGTTHQYYLADRATKGIDVVNSLTGAPYGTAGAGSFVGNGFLRTGETHASNGGPNGVAPIGNGLVAAGDGDSTLKIVQVFSAGTTVGTTVATIQTPNMYTGPNLPGVCANTPNDAAGVPTSGAGNGRVDELAWDPTDSVILAISDVACPVLATFYSSNAPYAILAQVPLTTANGGGEQPVWDAKQGKFFVAIPSTTANPDGVIDIFDPKLHTLTGSLPLPTGSGCGPTGLALGKNEQLFMACANSFVTMNALTGAIINTLPSNGGDEVWYNPGADRFYGSAVAPPAAVTVADANGKLITTIPVAPVSHSIAVDPAMDRIFIPQGAAAGTHAGISMFGH